MRVFVWNHYGSTTVYEAQTNEQCEKILALLLLEVSDWGV